MVVKRKNYIEMYIKWRMEFKKYLWDFTWRGCEVHSRSDSLFFSSFFISGLFSHRMMQVSLPIEFAPTEFAPYLFSS